MLRLVIYVNYIIGSTWLAAQSCCLLYNDWRASGQGYSFRAAALVFERDIFSVQSVTEIVTHVDHLVPSGEGSDPLCVFVCACVPMHTRARGRWTVLNHFPRAPSLLLNCRLAQQLLH